MNTGTVFAMNSDGEVVGGSGHRVGRDELAQLIDKLLDSDSVDHDSNHGEIITYAKYTMALVACSPSRLLKKGCRISAL
jgi:hypothetical protein